VNTGKPVIASALLLLPLWHQNQDRKPSAPSCKHGKPNWACSKRSTGEHNIEVGLHMGEPEAVTLATILGLVQKLSAIERLRLVEHVLVELEPIVTGQEKKRRSLQNTAREHPLTEEEIRGIEWKLWGKVDMELPRQVLQLRGLWKDVPFDVSAEDIRQARQELSEALKRRAERL